MPASTCTDGPIPVEGIAEEPDGTPLGFVIVWVRAGYLGALDSAWVTDEPPGRLFRPDEIRIGHSSR